MVNQKGDKAKGKRGAGKGKGRVKGKQKEGVGDGDDPVGEKAPESQEVAEKAKKPRKRKAPNASEPDGAEKGTEKLAKTGAKKVAAKEKNSSDRPKKKKAKKGRLKAGEGPEPSSQIIFTFAEKSSFLKALKENGFNAIYDLNKIRRYLPQRTTNEIQHLIDTFRRKGQEMAKESRAEEEEAEAESENPWARASNRPSIEAWYSIIHEMVPPIPKKDDMALIFCDLFDQFADQFKPTQEDVDNPLVDYPAIYRYLAEVLRGKYPPELGSNESAVVLSLLEVLKQCLVDIEKERAFMRSAQWWEKESEVNTTQAYQMLNSAAPLPVAEEVVISSTPDDLRESTSIQPNSHDSDLNPAPTSGPPDPQPGTSSQAQPLIPFPVFVDSEEHQLQASLVFPKIRKIRECLNSLNVPISLLREEHATLKTTLTRLGYN